MKKILINQTIKIVGGIKKPKIKRKYLQKISGKLEPS